MNHQNKVREFYLEKRGSIPTPNEATEYFEEELKELYENNLTTEHFAKEAADVMFTLYGVCLSVGIDLDKAFDLVCESNMTKERTTEGKVQKGPDYVEPDMSQCLS